jgi:rhodanese-related sulfurtransferase
MNQGLGDGMALEINNSVSNLSPKQSWDSICNDENAVLVDVRTRAEWSFVGVPDLSSIGRKIVLQEWTQFPAMERNPTFLQDLLGEIGEISPTAMFFICRSGARSLAAAEAVAGAFGERGQTVDCVNVAKGFEGDLDADGHRGTVNGWKVAGLPWVQR